MKRTAFVSLFVAITLASVTGCSESGRPSENEHNQEFVRVDGDSTVYGITAEGTNDSILVFLPLPYNGSDPDTVSILEARRNRRFYGWPDTGDDVAILRSSEDSTKAKCVIMIQDLLGRWNYEVYPTLRHTPVSENKIPQHLKDMLALTREYTLMLKDDFTAYNLAERGHADDDQSPIIYPKARRFTQWHLYNGRLVFTETKRDSHDNRMPVCTDTVDIVKLRRDTLVLQFADGEHTYYRKTI